MRADRFFNDLVNKNAAAVGSVKESLSCIAVQAIGLPPGKIPICKFCRLPPSSVEVNDIERGIRMTLKHRFLLHNLLLVGGILLIGGISVWRLAALSTRINVTPSVYAEIRTIGNVAVDVAIVDGLFAEPADNRERIIAHLTYAIGGLDQFIQVSAGYGGAGDKDLTDAYVSIDHAASSARSRLQTVLDRVRAAPSTAASGAVEMRKTVDAALEDIDKVGSSCVHFMSGRQQAASGDLARNLVLIGILSAVAVASAIVLSILQYRLVMLPLQRLRSGVRSVAEAQFQQKLDPLAMGKSPEFLELAADFNTMAWELDGFYRRLEGQVRTKSRELVRSERLASVGFLAAGVAHEINNPLNIISGYAELTAKRLELPAGFIDEQTIEQARGNIRIIREEAFRCKEITEKLLSLSRSGDGGREDLDLAAVARDVAAMTGGLKNYRDRRLTLKLDSSQPLEVRANLTEMKQVLLNLTVNALEATSPVGGEVCIEGRRNDGWIELSVKDNGRGMGPDVLSHVFEPFFTARRGAGERGTGLGLSITHAIVENHQGRLEAASDGPGHGATFIVRLPALEGNPKSENRNPKPKEKAMSDD
jgi:signal transduction histidine kinase